MIKFITTTRPLSRCIVWPLAPLPRALARPLPALVRLSWPRLSCLHPARRAPLSWPRRLPYAAFIHAPRRPCV
uniref:Uncharacterized protein n=1 Tax=Siphoviridae sp. ctzyE57 TaxID=2827982 RepID=A0A8S5SGU2_9CAUD|nr:MAG TPA: hypothetical protein [Siphoviridae sp. ctzyE57]